ncbi:YheC/YheD family endospore coat-associated protein [Bacillus sp. AK128]
MKYQVLNKKSKKQRILVSKEFATRYNLTSKTFTLKIGQWSKQLPIVISSKISSHVIKLPKRIIPFTLPSSLKYEVNVEKDIIHIGPVIGLLVKRKNSFTRKTLKKYKSRLRQYRKINGLVFVFSAAGINTENQTITGYYYSPKKKSKWKKGIFPYPDSIFKRIRIKKDLFNKLQQTMGNTIFNSHVFNKQKLWEVCSRESQTSQLVPDTMRYKSYKSILKMLKKHEHVYIKPVQGMQGNGIKMVKSKDGAFIITDHRRKRVVLHSKRELKKYCKSKLTNKNGYLLQQGIATHYKGKHVDFRLYFQKDQNKEWICQGTVGRVSKKNSIVTNYKHLSGLYTGKKAIKLLFGVNNKEAVRIINQTVQQCKKVGNLIDQEIGHYGDVVFDVIIDRNKRAWILEINNRIYGTKSLKKLKKRKTLRKIRTTPIKYAKSLAGF